MAKKTSTSAAKKACYQRYQTENRHEENKIKRIERHLKRHPGDTKAREALGKLEKDGANYIRSNNNRNDIKAGDRSVRELQAKVKRLSNTGYKVANTKEKKVKKNTVIQAAFEKVGINSGKVFTGMQTEI